VFDKPRLLDVLRALVAADLEALERRQRDAQAGSTHEESRAEHAKDTRATEQSYLARGLAERVAEAGRMAVALDTLRLRDFAPDDAIAVSAIVVIEVAAEDEVELEDENAVERQVWWIVTSAGGYEVEQDGTVLRTLTPLAPLGSALIGLCAGDDGSYRTPRGERTFQVIDVS
jgi:transcription elongation GreA/GreB family factor